MEISADKGIWNLQGQKNGAMMVTETARVDLFFRELGYWQEEYYLLNRVQDKCFFPNIATFGMQFIC
jgi:hypothetical protein